MQAGRLGPAFLGSFDVTLEDINGRKMVKARGVHPDTGLRVILTFPTEGGGADLERFKARLARLMLNR